MRLKFRWLIIAFRAECKAWIWKNYKNINKIFYKKNKIQTSWFNNNFLIFQILTAKSFVFVFPSPRTNSRSCNDKNDQLTHALKQFTQKEGNVYLSFRIFYKHGYQKHIYDKKLPLQIFKNWIWSKDRLWLWGLVYCSCKKK